MATRNHSSTSFDGIPAADLEAVKKLYDMGTERHRNGRRLVGAGERTSYAPSRSGAYRLLAAQMAP